ncbi:TPA: hypothetical protein ACH5MI_004241 [Klebsiella quasipneumoniae]|uniref:hypothetical protein n=1 Tax=Klebsiella quasipneumoniae TaxID=1463165 RepID=UPI00125C0478|nr:hypothetical protein [Klebsiella quasipneumoniae]MDI3068956.1 hypothetical protein [Klebsiella quasipneumoniae]VAO20080.1 Uncharacterised protein [Klebsiella quasipneumoniae]HBT4816388.1 hypothetical protein [Klebsiella quasipneumoniae subsp. quasipneumoniae]HCI6120822.1 hypothetical protein [Klebsiella quasipneumoniae subsp. quasipneumoniae]
MADDIQKKYLKILLIKSTYKTLLGRPADPDGLKNYYHAISDKSLAESAQLLNASLINSDEFKGLTPSRMAFENVCIPPHPVSGIETQGQWAVKHIVSLIRYIVLPLSLKKDLPANSPRLRMRWYLYRKYFLSTSNYRDGFNAGSLCTRLPPPAGLVERDRSDHIIPHPLSLLSAATRTGFTTVSLYARGLCRSQTMTSGLSLPGVRTASRIIRRRLSQ